MAAYRITVEALTNAARHAAGARVRVALTLTDHELGVSIDDDGTSPDAWPAGVRRLDARTGGRGRRECRVGSDADRRPGARTAPAGACGDLTLAHIPGRMGRPPKAGLKTEPSTDLPGLAVLSDSGLTLRVLRVLGEAVDPDLVRAAVLAGAG